MKELKKIDLRIEKGDTYEEVVEGLPFRSDDECYTAWKWYSGAFAKRGMDSGFPERADPRGDSALVLSCFKWPPEIPDNVKELVALAVEHKTREAAKTA